MPAWTDLGDPIKPDVNGVIGGLLRDLAVVQTTRQRMWGYKRAAAAVAALDIPIDQLIQPDGTVARIANIGPASTRVILEVLATGESPTVEEAVAASPKRADVERSRRLREGFLSRAQVAQALRDPSLRGPSRAQYRGDLQMHSEWSDGSQTLEDICRTGRARGYDYAAVTDHSYGLPIAGGMPMTRVIDQHHEIDLLNAASAGIFRLLKGIECNIRADGSLDLSAEELARFEIVVAAPHAVLRSRLDQTGRMVAAVSTPGVHILGHPRGRMYGSRPGVSADWAAVFAAAARSGVAVELDGDPARQDLDYRLARLAVDAGCLFALDSDAHAVSQWSYAETALAHARLAGIPPSRVINTWPVDRLLAWAAERAALIDTPAGR